LFKRVGVQDCRYIACSARIDVIPPNAPYIFSTLYHDKVLFSLFEKVYSHAQPSKTGTNDDDSNLS
jgi:hypothetical protein